MGPYILIFKTRSIELHCFISLLHLNSSNPSTWPSLKHLFPMTFRDVSFSDCSHSHNPISETDTYATILFAYDVIQGLFQYVVQLTLSSEPSALPPFLQVTLVGIYPLVMAYSGRGMAALPSMETTTMTLTNPTITYSTNFSSSLNQAHLPGLPALHQSWNASEANTRGFVSTHAMGPQGKRAIWIERKRSSTVREVQVWSKEPSIAGGLDPTSNSVSIPPEIARRVVYSVNSYDLRGANVLSSSSKLLYKLIMNLFIEDVTYCTFSELTGRIVLGSRSGDILILDLK